MHAYFHKHVPHITFAHKCTVHTAYHTYVCRTQLCLPGMMCAFISSALQSPTLLSLLSSLSSQFGTQDTEEVGGKGGVTQSAARQEWGALKVVAITSPQKAPLEVVTVQGAYLVVGSGDGVVRTAVQ